MVVGKRFILYPKKNWAREFLGSHEKYLQSDFENFRKFGSSENVLLYIPIKNWASLGSLIKGYRKSWNIQNDVFNIVVGIFFTLYSDKRIGQGGF